MRRNLLNWSSTALKWTTILVLAWATIGAVLFAMPWSTAAGLASIIVLVSWDHLPKWPRRAFAAALPFLTIGFVAQVAGPEYMRSSDEIGCEVRHLFDVDAPFCEGSEFERPAPGQAWAILNTREQWAVRWLNLSMAAGGVPLGFEDVAFETLLLMRGSSGELRTETVARPLSERRILCERDRVFPTEHFDADGTIALESSKARRLVSRLSKPLADDQSASARLRWGNYASRDQTWATTLALWVPQSSMRVERDEDRLHTTWAGTILYPATSQIAVKMPRPIGRSYRFALDEALFCAAQIDGVFVPYEMRWHASLSVDDERLREPAISQNDPGLVESLIRPLSNRLGLRHSVRIPPAVAPADDQ